MAQDEDLEALGPGVWATLATAGDETDEGDDDEIEERQHRPIVPGGSCTNRGFRPPRASRPTGSGSCSTSVSGSASGPRTGSTWAGASWLGACGARSSSC